MGKRLISLLLAQALCCSNLSLPVSASPPSDTLRPLDATNSAVSSHLRHDFSSLEATYAWSLVEPVLQDDAFIQRLVGWMEDAEHLRTILVDGETIAAQTPGFFIAWQLALERFQQRRKLPDLQAAAQASAARVLIHFSPGQPLPHRLSRLLRDVNEAGAATDLEPSWFEPISEPPSVPIDLAIGSHAWLSTIGASASVKAALDTPPSAVVAPPTAVVASPEASASVHRVELPAAVATVPIGLLAHHEWFIPFFAPGMESVGWLAAPIVLLSAILHEIAHGWMAKRFGDDTAARAGRLSLLKFWRHLDPLGTMALILSTMALGVPVGWMKPVPVAFSRLTPAQQRAVPRSAPPPTSRWPAAWAWPRPSSAAPPGWYSGSWRIWDWAS